MPERNEAGLVLVKTANRVLEPRGGTLAEVKESKAKDEEIILKGYENWHLPDFSQRNTWAASGLMAGGMILIILLEWGGSRPGGGREEDAKA